VIERSPARSDRLRLLADQAFSRAAGAPLIEGNAVRVLRDAAENFPAWLDAIRSAEHRILFESYIFQDDATGREFRDALVAKAKAGVRVFVLRDWLGSPGKLTGRFWRPLVAAGGLVRAFNPPRFDAPLGWLSRDHRKSIAVDGRVAFVSGLCVSSAWCGDPAKGKDPWRDTGIELKGPAIADIERAFAQVWATTGEQLADADLTDPASIDPAGEVSLRVVASAPAGAELMRLDQLITSIARDRLWLADAYFVPVTAYVQALCAAAKDEVDVRLLVPGASDLPLVSRLSRSIYRPLLEAGVRVFEWNGTMMHAKTAVADGRWARVGSTNLNVASFIGNYELDVAVEDAAFASEMERLYVDDLGHATEILIRPGRRFPRPARPRVDRVRRAPSGSVGRAVAGTVRFGAAMRAAITRPGPSPYGDTRVMLVATALLVAIAVTGALWPRVVAWPLAATALWFAIALLIRAGRGLREARRSRRSVKAGAR
jgi:cardiolipin synthase